MTTVFIGGVAGNMGQRVAKTIAATDGVTIAGGLDIHGQSNSDFPVFTSVDQINVQADVWLDFTIAAAAKANANWALQHGFDVVIGTSGLDNGEFNELGQLATKNHQHLLIVPNFAISAVLMMQFAQKAAQYFPDAEVVEAHHADKVDSPSGTARATAQLISEARQNSPIAPKETDQPARGEWIDDVPVHALRLPGYVAQEEVLFGAAGESLSIKQVSFDRSSFMQGVVLAAQKVGTLPEGLTVGLDALL
ncbi:4-hydroxy-tetrahydrodipicolinate reductase [Lapidilactobacillus mulanensis]|uniref:4-hydroxy-tetrahydrodipicolinate reductase n=1 Tax=Lapidilactobacillus mulanensis TaxID=2485999 RepID=A0ABW4DLZ1_9LACO|nr:4-hydroxy-tetrahydrodipicolinate reductase [Lapidilactobacillus mulanensis]